MEQYILKNLNYLYPDTDKEKLFRLKDFSKIKGDIDDPWYTGEFETAYKEIEQSVWDFIDFCIENIR